ncbi:MAG: TPM domain-containing protein [Erysipelotrichaceae bacterium]|nr:TPM domain-containing protein [Erysipelotrichaceae bacterium]
MKRVMKSLILILLTALSVCNVSAAENHVYISDYEDYMSQKQYDDLNEDLQHIREDYDIDIYFIYDTSIPNSEDSVKKYAEKYVEDHAGAANTVAIVMSESSYHVAARGSAQAEVLNRSDVIWDRFYSRASDISASDPNAFYEGIVNCYQYVVKLVNEKVYDSDAPVAVKKALVNDYADLLSDAEEEKLNRKLQKIKDKYGFDTVIVTTNSLNGMSAGDYADDFYDYSQYGQDGLLFLLDMGDRTWYVSTKGKAIDYFTDYGIDEIVDEMMDDLGDAKYYDAFVLYGDRVEEYIINGNKGDIIDNNNQKEKKSVFGALNVGISAIVGAISSLITSLSLKANMHSVSRQHYARNYIVNNSFYINGASDMLVNRHVTRTHRPRRDDSMNHSGPSSFGGGGSHVHTSSSGSTHGGHGGHF